MRHLIPIAMALLCWMAPGWVAPTRADTAPATTLTEDGYGVLLGSPDAATQLEIFCEPQCPHCAQFEAASGERLAERLAGGELAVTYRWLTFLDNRHDNTASARTATALMAAADPSTPAAAYQGFVNELYRNQDSHGDGPSTTDLAIMAAHNGVAPLAIARIAAGLPIVDTAAMNTANRQLLNQANPQDPGTPTVYDLGSHRVLDGDLN